MAVRAVKSIIDRFCGGSAEELLLGMVDSAVLSRKQLERLARRIDEKTAEQKGKSHDAHRRSFSVYQPFIHLVNPAARALAVGLVVATRLAAFRRTSTSLRLLTWTAVLYSALAMPLLGWMLPPLPVPGSSVPSDRIHPVPEVASQYQQAGIPFREFTTKPAAIATTQEAVEDEPATAIVGTPTSAPASTSPSRILFPSRIGWTTLAAALYLAVAFILLLRFGIGLLFGRKLRLASEPIDDPRLITRLRSHAASLAKFLRLAESELISVPLTMGVLRSTILLPADWREWDDAKLNAVLAHEVSHVARRDALTQRLSLLHRAIFWFSPLAWWLDRHLADLAEQASDEAALSCGADRKDYARTLLGFFEALQTAPGRVWWQGVAMAKPGQAEQRVERILSWKGSVTMDRNNNKNRSIGIAVVALALPFSIWPPPRIH